MLAIAAGIVALGVIALVLGIVLQGSHNTPAGKFPAVGSDHWKGALKGASAADALFLGIPQRGLVLGKPSAPVEMELFIDVQCPFCKNYVESALTPIIRKYVRDGSVQIHLEPWAFISSQSFAGRAAVIAASFQDKAFEYAKVLYDNQGVEHTGWLTSTMREKIAASVSGLNLGEWSAAAAGSRAAKIGQGVGRRAKSDHIQGTPAVFVGRTGSKLHQVKTSLGPPDLKHTELALNRALAIS